MYRPAGGTRASGGYGSDAALLHRTSNWAGINLAILLSRLTIDCWGGRGQTGMTSVEEVTCGDWPIPKLPCKTITGAVLSEPTSHN